jgi:predicted small metal-binding protein
MYEYVCDKIIPGCTTKITGDTPERTVELASEHLHEHHGASETDSDLVRYAINPIIAR